MMQRELFTKGGVYVFGAASMAAGIINMAWGEFEPAHQPVQAWGDHIPGLKLLAYVAAVWLIAGGAAIMWTKTSKFGAFALSILYGIFVLFPLPRLYTAPHFLGQRAGVYVGVLVSICQLLILLIAAVVASQSLSEPASMSKRGAVVARWGFGMSAIIFGLAHFVSVQAVASMVPGWMPLRGAFWTLLSGTAFVLSGVAIISGVLDVLAARLLGLMLLFFSILVLTPIALAAHNHVAWGGDAYNLTAVGSAWIFSQWLADQKTISAI